MTITSNSATKTTTTTTRPKNDNVIRQRKRQTVCLFLGFILGIVLSLLIVTTRYMNHLHFDDNIFPTTTTAINNVNYASIVHYPLVLIEPNHQKHENTRQQQQLLPRQVLLRDSHFETTTKKVLSDNKKRSFSFAEEYCESYHHSPDGFLCRIEWDEWILASAFVREGDVVLEFGGRFGTTSCVLCRAVGSTGQVVVVEPDSGVQSPYLLRNLATHECHAHVVLGTVSMRPQVLYHETVDPSKTGGTHGYAFSTLNKKEKENNNDIDDSTFQQSSMMDNNKFTLPHISLQDLERAIQRQFNVALIDCEGCLESVYETGLLHQVDIIIMEEDGLNVNYTHWHSVLTNELNFDCTWYLLDSFGPLGPLSSNLRHSVWMRRNSTRQAEFPFASCRDFMEQTEGSRIACASKCPAPGRHAEVLEDFLNHFGYFSDQTKTKQTNKI